MNIMKCINQLSLKYWGTINKPGGKHRSNHQLTKKDEIDLPGTEKANQRKINDSDPLTSE
jgi:hypothetical protein